MPAGVLPVTLTTLIPSIGVANVYVGSATVASGLGSLGITEGDIPVDMGFSENVLTAPEFTGGIPHQVWTMLDSATVAVPLIVSNTSLWASISPTGTGSAGWSSPQAVQETTLLLIPKAEVGGGLTNSAGTTAGWTRTAGQGILGGTGSTVAPINAHWLWRGYFTPGNRPFRFAEGGKMIVTATFHAMLDVTKPEGQKVVTVGDPAAQGVTTIRL